MVLTKYILLLIFKIAGLVGELIARELSSEKLLAGSINVMKNKRVIHVLPVLPQNSSPHRVPGRCY